MSHFFVSYNSTDREWVRRFVPLLRHAFEDVTVFFDVERLEKGEEWWEAILNNLAISNVMICVLSAEFFRSKYCRAEYLEARRLNIPILGIRWRENIALPFEFRTIQNISMGWPESGVLPVDVYRALTQLSRKTKAVASGTRTPHPDRTKPSYWDWPEDEINLGWFGERTTIVKPKATTETPTPTHIPTPTPTPNVRVQAPDVHARNEPSPRVLPVTAFLPPPYDWCSIPGGAVQLAHNNVGDRADYIPAAGLLVSVEPFEMGQYCITNAQFEKFISADDGYPNSDWWDFSAQARAWRMANPRAAISAFRSEKLPRTKVSWYSAVAFCRWLSKKTGDNIFLPTDAQWQLAALGTGGNTFPWGNTAPTTKRARFGRDQGDGPVAVDLMTQGKSPYGVFNMVGNVWEWVLTGWETGKPDLSTDATHRILRGGAFESPASSLRTALRLPQSPERESDTVGFRCARASL